MCQSSHVRILTRDFSMLLFVKTNMFCFMSERSRIATLHARARKHSNIP